MAAASMRMRRQDHDLVVSLVDLATGRLITELISIAPRENGPSRLARR